MIEIDTSLDRETIAFDDYDKAVQFVAWMRKFKSNNIGKNTLGFESGRPLLTPVADFDALAVIRRLDQQDDADSSSCDCSR